MTDDVGESFPLDIPGSWTQSDADVAAIVINVIDVRAHNGMVLQN